MNFIIFDETEVNDKNQAIVSDIAKISHIKERFMLKEGEAQKCGIVGKNRGNAIFRGENKDENKLYFDLELESDAIKKENIEVLISVCRPQTNKKIFHICQSLGVEKISFVRGENIPKSYLDSQSLDNENVRKECMLAMEQTGDTIFTKVEIYKTIYEYFKNNDISESLCLVADTSLLANEDKNKEIKDFFKDIKNIGNYQKIIIAIGPESGWSEKEIEYLHTKSFKSVGLGERVLRVEVALSFFLGILKSLT